MPLAYQAGRIARPFQAVGKGCFSQRQTQIAAVAIAAGIEFVSETLLVSTCQQSGAQSDCNMVRRHTRW